MDEWVPRSRINPLDELIEEEPIVKKKKKGDEKR